MTNEIKFKKKKFVVVFVFCMLYKKKKRKKRNASPISYVSSCMQRCFVAVLFEFSVLGDVYKPHVSWIILS